jgi:hypothetical protein
LFFVPQVSKHRRTQVQFTCAHRIVPIHSATAVHRLDENLGAVTGTDELARIHRQLAEIKLQGKRLPEHDFDLEHGAAFSVARHAFSMDQNIYR